MAVDPNTVQQAPDIVAIISYYFPQVASLGIAPLLAGAYKGYNVLKDIRDALVKQNTLLETANSQRERALNSK
jgi:hypothetical protein